MARPKRQFTIFDTMDFPDYKYEPYPRALQLPYREARIKEAQAKLSDCMKITDPNLRDAAMSIAKQDLENAIHAHVQVNNEAEEKAQLAKWALEAKTKAVA